MRSHRAAAMVSDAKFTDAQMKPVALSLGMSEFVIWGSCDCNLKVWWKVWSVLSQIFYDFWELKIEFEFIYLFPIILS